MDQELREIAEAQVRGVVVNPRYIRFTHPTWYDEPDVIASLAMDVLQFIEQERLSLADLRSLQMRKRLDKKTLQIYALRLYEGVRLSDESARREFFGQVERYVRQAQNSKTKEPLIHDLRTALARINGESYSQSEELIEEISYDLAIKLIESLQKRSLNDPYALPSWIEESAHNFVVKALKKLKQIHPASLDAPLGGSENGESKSTLGDFLADIAPGSAPDREVLTRESRETVFTVLGEYALTGATGMRDVLLILLDHYGIPLLPGMDPEAPSNKKTINRDIAETLMYWRDDPEGLSRYLMHIGLSSERARALAPMISDALTTETPQSISGNWVKNIKHQAYGRLKDYDDKRGRRLMRELHDIREFNKAGPKPQKDPATTDEDAGASPTPNEDPAPPEEEAATSPTSND